MSQCIICRGIIACQYMCVGVLGESLYNVCRGVR